MVSPENGIDSVMDFVFIMRSISPYLFLHGGACEKGGKTALKSEKKGPGGLPWNGPLNRQGTVENPFHLPGRSKRVG